MRVKNYIENFVTNIKFKKLLLECYSSSNITHQLYCLCILIELKYNLLPLSHYEDVISLIERLGSAVDFDSFRNNRPNIFSIKCNLNTVNYSRVVTKDTFVGYIGDFLFSQPYIDASKIALNGWSTKNQTVWITPTTELHDVINNSNDTTERANDVCDFLGLAREYDDVEYLLINYSPNFNECVYQPNSSNVLWSYKYILFLAYKQIDGFGRTYNENRYKFAREQVHPKSFYFDDKFSIQTIGKVTEKYPINDNIIIEAINRLEI